MMTTRQPVRVLMVCMGNICRSPMAHAVMQRRVNDAGLSDRVVIDSAGTHAYHVGERPHRGTLDELARRGVDVGDQRARQVCADDLDAFDYIAVMDAENLRGVRELVVAHGGEEACTAAVFRLLDEDVPDPWYEGGFDRVYELVDTGCRALLDRIRDEHDLT